MPVDKAFEAEKADMQIQSKGPLIDEMRRAWFYAGYQAGQKTISPEVRDIFLMLRADARGYDSVTRKQYCVHCGKQGEDKHQEYCHMYKIEKLLEAGE